MKKIVYILFALLLTNTSVLAAEWNEKSKAEMQEAVAQWFYAYELKDVNKVLAGIPPGFMRYSAYKLKITPLQMEPRLRKAQSWNFANKKSIAFNFDPEKIIYRQTPNGELYALIPHNTHIVSIHDEVNDEKLVELAFQVGGAWYFIDAEDPDAIDSLRTIYPYFKDADVSIPDSAN